MKRIYRSIGLLLATCALLSLASSCKKDNPKAPELPKIVEKGKKAETKTVDLRLDKSELELSAKQGESASATLQITQGNGEYTASTSSERVQVAITKSELTITATATEADYTATITVKDKAGKTADVKLSVKTIKEEAKPAEPTPAPQPTPEKPKPTPEPEKPAPQPEQPKAVELTLNQSAVKLEALEGKTVSATVQIKSGNGEYKLTSSDVLVKPSLKDKTITITATAKSATYSATVTITDKEKKSATIAVTVNTTPKPAEPTPPAEKPKPVQPTAPDLKLEKHSLYLEGVVGQVVEGTIRILAGSGEYWVRPQPLGSPNHLADGSGKRGDDVLFRMTVDTKKYTEHFNIIDSKTGKGETVEVTVVPKNGGNNPGNGNNNGGHKDSDLTPDGQFTYGDLNKWHKDHPFVYTFISGGKDRGMGGSLVASVGGKQIIGAGAGATMFKITYQGNLNVGTYPGATLTSPSKKSGASCTVVITKNDGKHFWGYFFAEGQFKGRFCDKVK